jgi:hypothetical protein
VLEFSVENFPNNSPDPHHPNSIHKLSNAVQKKCRIVLR